MASNHMVKQTKHENHPTFYIRVLENASSFEDTVRLCLTWSPVKTSRPRSSNEVLSSASARQLVGHWTFYNKKPNIRTSAIHILKKSLKNWQGTEKRTEITKITHESAILVDPDGELLLKGRLGSRGPARNVHPHHRRKATWPLKF